MEWVHVREEMPSEGQTVLIATAGWSVGIGYFGGGEGWVVESLPWGEEEVGDEVEVAWWMPVPPPPSWQRRPRGRITVKVLTWPPSSEGGEDTTDE